MKEQCPTDISHVRIKLSTENSTDCYIIIMSEHTREHASSFNETIHSQLLRVYVQYTYYKIQVQLRVRKALSSRSAKQFPETAFANRSVSCTAIGKNYATFMPRGKYLYQLKDRYTLHKILITDEPDIPSRCRYNNLNTHGFFYFTNGF